MAAFVFGGTPKEQDASAETDGSAVPARKKDYMSRGDYLNQEKRRQKVLNASKDKRKAFHSRLREFALEETRDPLLEGRDGLGDFEEYDEADSGVYGINENLGVYDSGSVGGGPALPAGVTEDEALAVASDDYVVNTLLSAGATEADTSMGGVGDTDFIGGGYGGESAEAPLARGPGGREMCDLLMRAEYMYWPPPNLGSGWVVVPAPKGRRTLVTSNHGWTVSRTKEGKVKKRFPSYLPGGNKASDNTRGRDKHCILDCVFSYTNKTYYVLDLLVWTGHEYFDFPVDFRFSWRDAKLAETPVSESTSKNPYVFESVPMYPATPAGIVGAYTDPLPYERDGLLFYFLGGHYEPGQTPLVLLIKGDRRLNEKLGSYVQTGVISPPPLDGLDAETRAELERQYNEQAEAHAQQQEEMNAIVSAMDRVSLS